DRISALLLYVFRNVVLQRISMRLFLMRISKAAQTIEAGFFNPFLHFFKILFRFAWVTGDQGSTHGNTRHFVAYLAYQVYSFLPGDTPAHRLQHIITDVLQWHIEVFADILAVVHRIQYLHRETGWVSIL